MPPSAHKSGMGFSRGLLGYRRDRGILYVLPLVGGSGIQPSLQDAAWP